jgi:acetyl-CoA carboxylase biotin carboxyl carrier protein
MKIKVEQLEPLAKFMHEQGLEELEIAEGKYQVRLVKEGAGVAVGGGGNNLPTHVVSHVAPAVQASSEHKPEAAEQIAGEKITSPMVGTFYASSSPDQPSFVKVGQKVSVGDTLCLIEAMKMFNEIKAEKAGTIKAILAHDGEPIEFNQPLFVIDHG